MPPRRHKMCEGCGWCKRSGESHADQFASFREDSQLRDLCLRQRTALDCGVASPFFSTFKRTLLEMPHLSTNATAFGMPSPMHVEETLDAFKALFRHFCYGLGNDLTLPKGAFYAGSSCVAALASSFGQYPGDRSAQLEKAQSIGIWRGNRLAVMEQRVQKIMLEPLVLKTISKIFEETSLAAVIMEFAHDSWTLQGFHRSVEAVLKESAPHLRWDLAWDTEDEEEEDDDVVPSSFYFDQNGSGPYARSDIDIVVVAQTDKEAAGIIQKTLEKVTNRYGDCRVYQTPCSVQIIGDFPLRHVQIITVINKSLDEYLLFCDLDCTALAFDGQQLYGSRRAYLALNSGYNIVPQEMLENRNDTPRRLHKYFTRGFASLLLGQLTETARTLLGQAEAINPPQRFLDIDWFENNEQQMVATVYGSFSYHANLLAFSIITMVVEAISYLFIIISLEGKKRKYHFCLASFWSKKGFHKKPRNKVKYLSDNSGRIYTETNLPRGHGITAAMTNTILKNLQAAARKMGRRTTVSPYVGIPDLVFKMVKTPENWVRWGLCISPAAENHIDIPSTPELTPR